MTKRLRRFRLERRGNGIRVKGIPYYYTEGYGAFYSRYFGIVTDSYSKFFRTGVLESRLDDVLNYLVPYKRSIWLPPGQKARGR